MESFTTNIMPVINVVSMIVTGVVVIATVIVRITPTDTDDKAAKSISDTVLKILKHFPTIGVNPQTKKLEEALINLSGDNKKTEVVQNGSDGAVG